MHLAAVSRASRGESSHALQGITNAFITLDGGAGQGQAFTPEKFNALVKRWLGINPKQIRCARSHGVRCPILQ